MGIGNIGWTEFLVILAIALIFFGPRRLPGIAQAIGKSLREFQRALNEVKSEIAEAGRDADTRDTLRSSLPRPAEILNAPADTPASPQSSAESERPGSETTPTPHGAERPAPEAGAGERVEGSPAGDEGEEDEPARGGQGSRQIDTTSSETEADGDDRGKDSP